MSLQVRSKQGTRKPWRGWVCTKYTKQGGSRPAGCKGSVPYEAISQAVRNALDKETVEREVMAYLKTIAAPGPEDQREKMAVDLARAEKLMENRAQAMDLGRDMPMLVARWKEAQANVEALRATLSTQQAISDRWEEVDPEVLAGELRLTQAALAQPDLTADRKALRSLGVTITVDSTLKEAIIMGTLDTVVSSKLGYASCTVPVGGRWISLWASEATR